MLTVTNLVQALKDLSSGLGIYQFVIPLNNVGLGGVVTSAVSNQSIAIPMDSKGLPFEYGWLHEFPSLPSRPTKLVVLRAPWVLIDDVVKHRLTDQDILDVSLHWHLVESTKQTVFLSVGFQLGVCWPWHKDTTVSKQHKLLEGEVDFVYKDSTTRLPLGVLTTLDTSKTHTIEQLSPTRVDLIFDSKEIK